MVLMMMGIAALLGRQQPPGTVLSPRRELELDLAGRQRLHGAVIEWCFGTA